MRYRDVKYYKIVKRPQWFIFTNCLSLDGYVKENKCRERNLFGMKQICIEIGLSIKRDKKSISKRPSVTFGACPNQENVCNCRFGDSGGHLTLSVCALGVIKR